MKVPKLFLLVTAFVAAALATASGQQQQQQQQDESQSFRFRTAVELINVTVTVTDGTGRFVSGLRREDFRIFEDGVEQPVSHFSNDRVPVSLGIALDTSGSMDGDKMRAARTALNRFLFDLLDRTDEVFLYRFDSNPELVEGWTTDRRRVSSELERIRPKGGTAMYDTVAEAVPMAQSGTHRKKALLVISDGNDTSSRTEVPDLKQMIRETEVLVYAIGIDGTDTQMTGGSAERRRYAERTTQPGSSAVPVPRPAHAADSAAAISAVRAVVSQRARRRPRQRLRLAGADRRQRRTHGDHSLGDGSGPGDCRDR